MERIYTFLPSTIILIGIAGVTLLYMKLVIKRFGDNFRSIEWHEKNKWRVAWTVSMPLTNVYGPAVEELIFRAPLIVMFSAMSPVAWYGIFASSGVFALLHWFGKKIWMLEILSARENSDHKTDDVVAEMNRLYQENGRAIMVRKVLHVIFAMPLGILTGYYGIKYQSIWVAVGIHSAWNLIMPLIISILVFLGLALFSISSRISSLLWDKMRRGRRR